MLHSPPSKPAPFQSAHNLAQHLMNQHLARPRELLKADRHRVLMLTLQPGDTLPEQYHLYAKKTLMVLEGCATILLDDKARVVHETETCNIPFATAHRISNCGKIPLQLLEVRTGACVEDHDSAS